MAKPNTMQPALPAALTTPVPGAFRTPRRSVVSGCAMFIRVE
ncbi:hypothetical protein [Siccibacter turicensis]|nr:hypothetical protein [Siccibacter turicensis]